MRPWFSMLSLLTILVAATSGCAPYQMGYRPMRPGVVCDPTHCPGTCGPMRAPACESGCTTTECDPCDPCGSCYYGHYSPFGPLAAVFRLFRPVAWVGPSCGERYWGDYYSEPPDCCDPCDCHGNFTGMQMGPCRNGSAGVCADCARTCGHSNGGGYPANPGLVQRQPVQKLMGRPVVHQRPNGYLLRSPAGTASLSPDTASRYAPRVISIDDRVVGEPSPNPTMATRRLEAARR